MTDPDEWVVPPRLAAGARVRVIAPSGPFDRALVLRGLGWLSERYRVEFDRELFARDGFLAGSDERRLGELSRALTDPGVAAVAIARGGYGLGRIVHRAPIAQVRQHARWVIGFSDATALHVELARERIASLHGPNVAALGRADAPLREAWTNALEQPDRGLRIDGLRTVRGGRAEGRLFGGNLTVLFTCAAAGRLEVPPGTVLLLEDVTEQSYRVDRMLTALAVAGHLDRVVACVVGDFTDCPSGTHGVTIDQVIEERLGRLGVPVLADLPVGHGDRNRPMPLGLRVRVEADEGRLTILPPAG